MYIYFVYGSLEYDETNPRLFFNKYSQFTRMFTIDSILKTWARNDVTFKISFLSRVTNGHKMFTVLKQTILVGGG